MSAINIRITPVAADEFRRLWKRMQKLEITEDFGGSLRTAIRNELINLQLRWQDAINDAEYGIKKEKE